MNHDAVEKNIGLMIVLIIVAISFGALVELVPLMFGDEVNEPIEGLEPLSFDSTLCTLDKNQQAVFRECVIRDVTGAK